VSDSGRISVRPDDKKRVISKLHHHRYDFLLVAVLMQIFFCRTVKIIEDEETTIKSKPPKFIIINSWRQVTGDLKAPEILVIFLLLKIN